MKINLLFSKLPTIAMAFMIIVGIQTRSDAQITVINATACDITVFIGQNDVSTLTPCDLCPINPPTAVLIPAGSPPVDIFGQDVCGEQFGWIRWQVAGSFGSGISPNPGLFGFCVPNITGPGCSTFAGTNAFWLSSGNGPVTVAIFG